MPIEPDVLARMQRTEAIAQTWNTSPRADTDRTTALRALAAVDLDDDPRAPAAGWTPEPPHTGPVDVRFTGWGVTVLCPVGHLVTARAHGPDLAGSAFMADVTAHQHGSRPWTVTCHGAAGSSN